MKKQNKPSAASNKPKQENTEAENKDCMSELDQKLDDILHDLPDFSDEDFNDEEVPGEGVPSKVRVEPKTDAKDDNEMDAFADIIEESKTLSPRLYNRMKLKESKKFSSSINSSDFLSLSCRLSKTVSVFTASFTFIHSLIG